MRLTLISAALALAFGVTGAVQANPVVNGDNAGRGAGNDTVDQSSTANSTQGNGPNANEFSAVTTGSNNTDTSDTNNDKSTGDNRNNNGTATAQDYGNAAANNGSTATSNFSDAFNNYTVTAT